MAEPLFIVSAVLVMLGALTCSRVVTLLAVGGSVLLYLSMLQLASSVSVWRRRRGGCPPLLRVPRPLAAPVGSRRS